MNIGAPGLLQTFQTHKQKAGSEVRQLEQEQAHTWDASTIQESLVYYNTMSAPRIPILHLLYHYISTQDMNFAASFT